MPLKIFDPAKQLDCWWTDGSILNVLFEFFLGASPDYHQGLDAIQVADQIKCLLQCRSCLCMLTAESVSPA